MRMGVYKNYYVILGVAADASSEDVKAAFRRRARELHPDRSGLESGPFQEVQEAYSVLVDPDRRRRYDRDFGHAPDRRVTSSRAPEPFRSRQSRGEPFRPIEPARGFREVSLTESFATYHPSFEELFDRFWSNFDTVSRPKAETLESLTVEVLLSPKEAAWGGQARVWIPARVVCQACGGRGAIGVYECWRCEGHGALTTEFPIDIDYPVGLSDGYAVRIPLTRYGIGNLYLTVLFRVS